MKPTGTLGTIVVDGVTVDLVCGGTVEVPNIDGTKKLYISITPVIRGGGPDGGEPMPIAA